MKTVYLTADDYGYNAAVDDAILTLMAAGRLSGAGCMTRAPGWPTAASRIVAAGGFGLHLDFTEFSPPRRPLWPLIGAALARRLDATALRDEIATQCALFEEATGRAPAYVDGHQHVHQLPQIREALVEVLVARYTGRLPWLRISGARIGDGAKPLFIAALGAAALERLAFAARIRTTPRLLGAYGFDGDANGYRQRLSGWLGNAADGDAVMVHPATQALPGDPIGAARVHEYGVLASDTLPALLAANAVELGALGA
ncbi:ChbG/HpnK family deacetylase [Methyloversatilis discipulorum]|uniref:ChbG/HpnK family deacetylase n=1 Tax=Methyloversatilis discipulorum TaxID=1119528 RepID=UPI001A628751|nr:ChbG/HpnK family deacetylase [Methyloversatilis discipulorum]MBL8467660.1 ChbG/HpnK family deacetylase [Methyloversatilis discipulorum]